MAVVMAMAVVMGYMPSMQGCFVACFDEAGRKAEGGRKATEEGEERDRGQQTQEREIDTSDMRPTRPKHM